MTRLTILTLALSACGGSTAHTGAHSHYFADDHDLESRVTYALVEAEVPEGFYDEHHAELFGTAHDAIHERMAASGRTETDPATADIVVSYTIGGRSHPVQVRRIDALDVPQPMDFPAHEEKMVFVVFERETGRKLFEASYDHLVREENEVDENQQLVRDVVSRVFGQFPHATASAEPEPEPAAAPAPAAPGGGPAEEELSDEPEEEMGAS